MFYDDILIPISFCSPIVTKNGIFEYQVKCVFSQQVLTNWSTHDVCSKVYHMRIILSIYNVSISPTVNSPPQEPDDSRVAKNWPGVLRATNFLSGFYM